MLIQLVILVTGMVAGALALGNDNVTRTHPTVATTTPPNTKTRELDILLTTSTTSAASIATKAPSPEYLELQAIQGLKVPDTHEHWYQYFANSTLGMKDEATDKYLDWLLNDNFVVYDVSVYGDNEILPGTCEAKVRELDDRLMDAARLREERVAAMRVAIQGQTLDKEGREHNFRLSLERVQEDQLWLLRSYIRCCTSRSGRYTLFSDGTASDNMVYEHEKNFDRGTACPDQKKYYEKWLKKYLSEAEGAGHYVEENKEKFPAQNDDITMRYELARRDRIIAGYTRCCRDIQPPGPAPMVGVPFPSVPKTPPFRR
ncbi:hypothetical protein SCUP515_03851 [Seiridium cupressi]